MCILKNVQCYECGADINNQIRALSNGTDSCLAHALRDTCGIARSRTNVNSPRFPSICPPANAHPIAFYCHNTARALDLPKVFAFKSSNLIRLLEKLKNEMHHMERECFGKCIQIGVKQMRNFVDESRHFVDAPL